MTRLRRLTASVALVGLLAGTAAAVAIPRSSGAAPDRPLIAPEEPLRQAASRPRELGPRTRSTIYLRAHAGTVHIEQRRRDPAGGPDWVLRVYEADRMITESVRRPGTNGVISVGLCTQLLREVDGRLGWIDGTNTFRPVSTAALEGSPTICGSRVLDARHQPEIRVTNLLDDPRSQDPRVRGSVIWGLVGQRVRSTQLGLGSSTETLARAGAHGTFMRFAGPSRSVSDPLLTVTYPDGKRVTARVNQPVRDSARPLPPERLVVRGSSQVIARASDPGGGPSWGARAARTTAGDWCLGPAGYLIDGRIGEIDEALGTLYEQPEMVFPNGCDAQTHPGLAMPIQYTASAGSFTDVPQLDPGRGSLRLLPGRSYLWGRAASDVESITIAAPRDVRTIVPSGPARGFVAVYDGTDFGGPVTFTAHFEDGHDQVLQGPQGDPAEHNIGGP